LPLAFSTWVWKSSPPRIDCVTEEGRESFLPWSMNSSEVMPLYKDYLLALWLSSIFSTMLLFFL
jgi:hypothetical protein